MGGPGGYRLYTSLEQKKSPSNLQKRGMGKKKKGDFSWKWAYWPKMTGLLGFA
jgi:hypothetical protein